jgi:hypothetical protein
MNDRLKKLVTILFVSTILLSFSYLCLAQLKWMSIINKFKEMPSIIAQMDQDGRYYGDYYISIDSIKNSEQHIHMIFKRVFMVGYSIKYVFKKYGNIHSNGAYLNIYDSSADTTCRKLISDFKDFI